MAALNVGRGADIGPVSCPLRGNGAVGGDYRDSRGRFQAFVDSEAGGRWGRALRLSGAGLRASDAAGISSVSCPSPGNCTAAGPTGPPGSSRRSW